MNPIHKKYKNVLLILLSILLFYGAYRIVDYSKLFDKNTETGRYLRSIIKIISYRIDNLISLQKTKSTKSDDKGVMLEQVNNVGYSFYLGKIDYPGTPEIEDEIKNDITQIIYDVKLPKSLAKKMAIIIVNTLAVSSYQYINAPGGRINIIDFPPVFIKGGGVYSQFTGQMSLIYLNKNLIKRAVTPEEKQFFGNSIIENRIKDVLPHELGHYIGSQLTVEEWLKYYKLRGIPANTPVYGQNWFLSPGEDFAEVYTSIFTGSGARSGYGLLLPSRYFVEGVSSTCGKIRDAAKLQNCRRDVLMYPEKYPEDKALIGSPYYSVVDSAIKEFISSVVERLNLQK